MTAAPREAPFIDGGWREPVSGRFLAVHDPATEEPFAEAATVPDRDAPVPSTPSATFASTWPRRAAEGKPRLVVAIDRTSRFAFVRLVTSAGKMEAARFLRDPIEAVPYQVHTVLDL